MMPKMFQMTQFYLSRMDLWHWAYKWPKYVKKCKIGRGRFQLPCPFEVSYLFFNVWGETLNFLNPSVKVVPILGLFLFISDRIWSCCCYFEIPNYHVPYLILVNNPIKNLPILQYRICNFGNDYYHTTQINKKNGINNYN